MKAKSIIERFVREEITNFTINIKWEYYLKISQGDISKAIISEGRIYRRIYVFPICYYLFGNCNYIFNCLFNISSKTFLILLIYGLFAYRIYIFYSEKADYFGKNLSEITSNIGKWTSSIFNNLKYLRAISLDKLTKGRI